TLVSLWARSYERLQLGAVSGRVRGQGVCGTVLRRCALCRGSLGQGGPAWLPRPPLAPRPAAFTGSSAPPKRPPIHSQRSHPRMQDSPFMAWIQETTFLGVPLWSLLVASAAAVATYVAILVVLSLLTGRAKRWASQSDSGMA